MTHNEKVLALLSDGQPHTHHELYALHVIGHSRIADLRKQGYVIDRWTEEGPDGRTDYIYKLSLDGATMQEGTRTDPTRTTIVAPSSERDRAKASVGASECDGDCVRSHSEQLDLLGWLAA